MKKDISLSIGLPAYNEEANIKKLLLALLSQKCQGFVLHEIIVASDASSDNTVKEALSIQDKRIKLIIGKKRIGKSARLNEIFKAFTGDVLILLDSDIIIKDDKLFSKLFQKSDIKKNGLIGVDAIPASPVTFFEKIVESGVLVMKDIAERWKNGDNYLSFKGCFLALNKKLAKSIIIPSDLVNNDAYIYFAAKQMGFTPLLIKSLKIIYQSPKTFADHLNQSSRHQSSRSELEQTFWSNMKNEYKIPLAILVRSTLKYLAQRPVYTLLYLVVRILTKVKQQKKIKSTWTVATSTKENAYD